MLNADSLSAQNWWQISPPVELRRLIDKFDFTRPPWLGEERLERVVEAQARQFAATIAGGCHVPSPTGSMEGASLFGQYRRMTR
jgi:hypothetical protein